MEIKEIRVRNNEEKDMVVLKESKHERLRREMKENFENMLRRDIKEDFEAHREKTKTNNINEYEECVGCDYSSSDIDNEDDTSADESSYSGYSTTSLPSETDSVGVSYMYVPQISLIPDYLELEAKIKDKSWRPKSEIYNKLRLFVEGNHAIVAKRNRSEREKDLEKLLNEVREGLKDKRYEKWKVLEDVFTSYYDITEGS